MTEPAPYRSDLALGPETRAAWLTCSDGVRLRIGHAKADAAKGTVFLLPGRSEYLEKYGHTASDLVDAGFDVLSIDWRGQGYSDRLGAHPMVGHVGDFADFQKDWAALARYAAQQGLPKPWHMVAHSMGGCIGLRALINGADITSVVFTGPMWGIAMAPHLRPVAWLMPRIAEAIGQGHRLAAGTSIQSYVTSTAFEDNQLTSDREMFAYMHHQVEQDPNFGLGGPSYTWLKSAIEECHALADKPSPAIPALCFQGSKERIVDTTRIRDRMTTWPGGKLLLVDGAEHEVLMEGTSTRRQITGSAVSLFSGLGR